jgi:hypothetical protein
VVVLPVQPEHLYGGGAGGEGQHEQQQDHPHLLSVCGRS